MPFSHILGDVQSHFSRLTVRVQSLFSRFFVDERSDLYPVKKQSVSGSVSTVWLTRGFLESFTYHKPTVVNARCKTTATDTFCEIAAWRKSHHDKGNTDEFPSLWQSHTPIPSNTATVYNIHRLQLLVAEVWQKLWNSDLCLKILSCSVPL